MVWASPLLIGLLAISVMFMIRSFRDAFNSRETISGFPGGGWIAVSQLLNLPAFGLIVLRMAWMYFAVDTARGLGLPSRRETGLACASWIIPIVNLWWPYQNMSDLVAPLRDQGQRCPVGTWWGCYCASSLAIFAAMGAAFAPIAIAIPIIGIGLLPVIISALLEHRLIMQVGALHTSLTSVPG